MRSEQYRPIWPYLAILTCLFGLSLTITPSWQRAYRLRGTAAFRSVASASADPAGSHDALAGVTDSSLQTPHDDAVSSLARLRNLHSDPEDPTPASDQLLSEPVAEEFADTQPAHGDPSVAVDPDALAQPRVQAIARDAMARTASDSDDRSADSAQGSLADAAGAPAEPLHDPSLALPGVGVTVSSSSDRLAMRPVPYSALPETRPLQPGPLADGETQQPTTPWAYPESLVSQLDELSQDPVTSDWANRTRQIVAQLTRGQSLDDAEVAKTLDLLRHQIASVDGLARRVEPESEVMWLLQVRYAALRRLEVWEAVHKLRSRPESPASTDSHRADSMVAQHIAAVAALTDGNEQGRAWRQYLMLDALQAAAQDDDAQCAARRRELAQRVLGRLNATRLTGNQQRFANTEPMAALDRALRQWSAEEAQPDRLLRRVETYETTGLPSDASLLAQELQSLACSPGEAERELAACTNRHYRNANLRIAVSNVLLNRWLPSQSPIEAEVRDVIAGAGVEGYSRTTTRLAVRLFPDARRLRLGLEAKGVVDSDTASSSGPVRIFNQGKTHYLARKIVALDRKGLRVWPAQADANSNSELVGLESDFDNVPLVRSLVHRIARSQHSEKQGQALSEVEQKVADAARRRMDNQADRQLALAQKRVREKILAPLERIGLSPTPLDMHTTAQRAVMRLRLAQDDQLGAHTPRPRAPSDSLISVQVHQSALNNALEQCGLDGRTFTLPELLQTVGDRLGKSLTLQNDDVPDDIQLTFAPTDAVRVQCEEGRVRLTVSLAELETRRQRYRDFKIHVFYRPEADGLVTQLVRDEGLQLEGSLGTRAQIALRGIFCTIFSQNRPVPVIAGQIASDPRLAGLEVTQLAITDGWFGLAIGPHRQPAPSPRTAQRKASSRKQR